MADSIIFSPSGAPTPALADRKSYQWFVPVALALFSLLTSAYVGYTSNDKDTAVKVVTVETQQKNDGERVGRIETKVDRMDSKLDRILERLSSREIK